MGDRLNMTGSEDKTEYPTWEFYDLVNDPEEIRNEYGNAKYSKVN